MQNVTDVLIEFKYHGYWYFYKEVDWFGVLAHSILIPPVNILLLSWYPFHSSFTKQGIYIGFWTLGVIMYEALALNPEPWGYFHLGWWKLWFEFIVVPFLIFILISFYKWICKAEERLLSTHNK